MKNFTLRRVTLLFAGASMLIGCMKEIREDDGSVPPPTATNAVLGNWVLMYKRGVDIDNAASPVSIQPTFINYPPNKYYLEFFANFNYKATDYTVVPATSESGTYSLNGNALYRQSFFSSSSIPDTLHFLVSSDSLKLMVEDRDSSVLHRDTLTYRKN